MPAHSCTCCDPSTNLIKVDPFTGAIIWKKHITGGGNSLTPVVQVEPIHSTNDVLVGTSYTTTQYVHRVSAAGKVIWKRLIPFVGNANTNARCIGSDSSGRIIVPSFPLSGSAVNAIQQLNPVNGNTVWTTTFSASGENVYSVITGAAYAVACLNVTFNSASNTIRKIDTSTGTTVLSAGNWNSSHDDRMNFSAEDSAGNWLSCVRTPIVASKWSGTTGTQLATATWKPQRARFGPGGYSAAAYGFSPYAIATGGTGLTASFSLTTIAGANLAGKLLDTCSIDNGYGSPLYYFVGETMTGTGGVLFSVFCVDSSGSFQWAIPWGIYSGGTAFSCCISDEGYLYVGGQSTIF